MYPDWPESDADLVPLPLCDGPKLKPFDFKGPQKIEFLKHLGQGLHSHVFEVKILGRLYALKLFRFVGEVDYLSTRRATDWEDREVMSAFYNYSEPFSCECRAYGRLQESGHEELATKCFGYVLLDKEHEDAVVAKFSEVKRGFSGNIDGPGCEELRTRFLGKGGRPPPVRGIVKEVGVQNDEKLHDALVSKVFRDMIKLQKLGILRIDFATRQIIDGKIGDFSTTITTPHFLTTPELNPHLSPEMVNALELQTFRWSLYDFVQFDDEIGDWNLEHEEEGRSISVRAFAGRKGCRMTYNLRSKAARDRVYTFVDPRKYDWRACAGGAETSEGDDAKRRTSGRPPTANGNGVLRGARLSSKKRRQLNARPRLWHFNCDGKLANELGSEWIHLRSLQWYYEGGFFVPRPWEMCDSERAHIEKSVAEGSTT